MFLQPDIGKIPTVLLLLFSALILCGCGAGNQPAKREKAEEKPASSDTAAKVEEQIPADPYAAMETERNAVKESISGKTSEIPTAEASVEQAVYSGVVEIVNKGNANQTIILKSNRGTFVLVGEKSAELADCEGRFVTVMGKLVMGNAVPADLKDLTQIQVQGVVRKKSG